MERDEEVVSLDEYVSDDDPETARISGASSTFSVSSEDDLSEVTELEIVDTTEWEDLPTPLDLPDYIGTSFYEHTLTLRKKELSPRRSRDTVIEDIEILGPGLTERSSIKSGDSQKKRLVSASDKLLNQRAFHQKSFVPFRYPLHFHSDGRKPKQKSFIKVPNSFQPKTRYGREPRVQGKRESDAKHRRWPQFPVYPPKARHAEVMCEIIRLAQTLDLGIQATPETTSAGTQSVAETTDTSTQYPKTRKCDAQCQTIKPEVEDIAIQNVPKMANKMEELLFAFCIFLF
ncbi:hypothetical protein CAPTEDRAFT_199561 [Capitella teleta]|uniref:Uncharacterized protein n=1 Tax=Capitella teleta TaxID=283909 RepID=R7VCL6_CAPTE|nr:hypothetical protein CAPTEDRAFT_199561 [Capitella teleta]|eukprot:ELU16292.1 hypothetical protein CAPTEDRAFT_199561 [Capitella teleta]